jgi:hypothetical protein
MARVKTISWWQWLPIFRWRIVGYVDAADEIPAHLPRNAAVIVGSPQRPKWVAFDCPCRTGHRIMVSLDPTHVPHWSLANEHPLTIRPSFDYRTPSRNCHFFIRHGRIEWAAQRGVGHEPR